MIIKTDQGQYIKVEDNCTQNDYVFGYRWNRNEQRWGRYCIRYSFKSYSIAKESELPKKLPTIAIDN